MTAVASLPPARVPRCLRLVVNKRGTNRCDNEQVPGADYCAHHLAAAVEQFNAIIAEHALSTTGRNT